MYSVGIDLAGKPENKTDIAALKPHKISTEKINTNKEKENYLKTKKTDILAIDSHLNLPKKKALEI